MSRVDDLIRTFCPNGVKFYELGELGNFYGGLTGKSKDDFTDGNAKFITYKNVYSNPALKIDVEDRVKIALAASRGLSVMKNWPGYCLTNSKIDASG